VAADLARAALLASVPAAALLGALRLEHLYLVALLAGAGTLFFDVAYLSYLPTLIPRDRLLEGNSKLAASASMAETAAFMASGWLVQWLTAPIALLIDAVTFLVSAASLIVIRAPEPDPAPAAGRPRLRIELLEGLGELWRSPPLRAVVLGAATQEFSLGVGGAVFMLFVTGGLGFKPGVLGMIFAVGGLSSLLGSVLAGACTRRVGYGIAMVAGLTLSGIATLLVPLARDAGLVAALLLIGQQAIGDGAAVICSVSQVTVRQALAPGHLQGRIHAGYRLLGMSAMLLGALSGGLVAQQYGMRAALVMGGLARIAASLWLLRSPAWGFMQKLKVAG
jgi:Na+/melibiose symporter-like transporter